MLKDIVTTIIPQNIKDITLVKDSVDVFINFITENSDISIDLKNAFDENKTTLHEQFLKTYVNNVYTVFKKASTSESLYNKLRDLYSLFGTDIDSVQIVRDINKYITSEHLMTNKEFKELKGTKLGVEYIYNLVQNSGILGDLFTKPGQSKFEFTSGPNLFEYNVRGSILNEAYELFVKPITHPLGWSYVYRRMTEEWFNDNFNLGFEYNITDMRVICSDGNEDNYLTNTANDKSKIFANDNDAKVELIEKIIVSQGTKKVIHFKNGYTLESWSDPISTILYDSSRNEIKNYNSLAHCSLHLTYTSILNILTKDEISFDVQAGFSENPSYIPHGPALIGATKEVNGYNLVIGEFLIGTDVIEIKLRDDLSFILDYSPELTREYIYNKVGAFVIGNDLAHGSEMVQDHYFVLHSNEDISFKVTSKADDIWWSTQNNTVTKDNIVNFLQTEKNESFYAEALRRDFIYKKIGHFLIGDAISTYYFLPDIDDVFWGTQNNPVSVQNIVTFLENQNNEQFTAELLGTKYNYSSIGSFTVGNSIGAPYIGVVG